MKFSKGLEWLRPYVEASAGVEPEVDKVVKVFQCHARADRVIQCTAQITHNEEKDTYLISIYPVYQWIEKIKPKPVIKLLPHSRLDILACLAHEIAHMKYWDHTPHRQKLENKLSNLFMDMLIKDGYVSEEDELRGRRGRKRDRKVRRC